MSRVAELAARREALLLQSAELRMRLAAHGDELEHSLGRVERGVSLMRSVTSKPLLLSLGAGLLFSIGPLRAFKWVSRGLFVTSLARRAYGLFAARRRSRPDTTDLEAF